MFIKYIPKRHDGQVVVSFVAMPTETRTNDLPLYKGVMMTEVHTDLYAVGRVQSTSLDSVQPWSWVPGDKVDNLTWSQAQQVLQTKIQGPH